MVSSTKNVDFRTSALKVVELVKGAERRGPKPISLGSLYVTSNVAEAGGFLRTRKELDRPDIQLHLCIGIVDNHNRRMHMTRGLSLHVCNLRPASRGTVRLAAADIRKPPLIDPGYLSHPGDMDTLVAGTRMAQRILAAPAFARYAGKTFYDADTDDETLLRQRIREHADTIYHPVGTCRMGSDTAAPVDPQLRVRGVSHLRVADASVMPTLISGNTQAPSAMIGERAADGASTSAKVTAQDCLNKYNSSDPNYDYPALMDPLCWSAFTTAHSTLAPTSQPTSAQPQPAYFSTAAEPRPAPAVAPSPKSKPPPPSSPRLAPAPPLPLPSISVSTPSIPAATTQAQSTTDPSAPTAKAALTSKVITSPPSAAQSALTTEAQPPSSQASAAKPSQPCTPSPNPPPLPLPPLPAPPPVPPPPSPSPPSPTPPRDAPNTKPPTLCPSAPPAPHSPTPTTLSLSSLKPAPMPATLTRPAVSAPVPTAEPTPAPEPTAKAAFAQTAAASQPTTAHPHTAEPAPALPLRIHLLPAPHPTTAAVPSAAIPQAARGPNTPVLHAPLPTASQSTPTQPVATANPTALSQSGPITSAPSAAIATAFSGSSPLSQPNPTPS
ncbi:MAG: hypothetical protein WDW38_011337 [Sanguina aurantia]